MATSNFGYDTTATYSSVGSGASAPNNDCSCTEPNLQKAIEVNRALIANIMSLLGTNASSGNERQPATGVARSKTEEVVRKAIEEIDHNNEWLLVVIEAIDKVLITIGCDEDIPSGR